MGGGLAAVCPGKGEDSRGSSGGGSGAVPAPLSPPEATVVFRSDRWSDRHSAEDRQGNSEADTCFNGTTEPRKYSFVQVNKKAND